MSSIANFATDMKRFYYILAILVVSLLSSCSKDSEDNPYTDAIVGTWQMYKFQTIANGKVTSSAQASGTMVFDAKGKMYYGEEFSYEVSGNTLIIKKDNLKDKAHIVILNQTDLILDFNYSSGSERRFMKKDE